MDRARSFLPSFSRKASQAPALPADTTGPIIVNADNNGILTNTASHTSLQRQISTTSFVYMALASSIGAGLLIATTESLKNGGPGGLVMSFALVGLGVWLTMCALSELAATFPVQGSFYNYSVKNISPAWGFAMGFNYTLNFILIVPFEITVMIMLARNWDPTAKVVNTAWFVPCVQLLLAGIAACGSGFFAKVEHGFGILKVVVLLAFTICAMVIVGGGVTSDPRADLGSKNWTLDGSFLHGASGFLSVFVAAGMAYGGTEMLGLTVAECKHPQRTASLASTITAARIVVCFLLPLMMLGFVLNPTEIKNFQKETKFTGSPFIIALRIARIRIFPDIVNGCIIAAVFSMANAGVFASSRALHALCAQGMGPRVLARTTRKGVPIYALAVVFLVSCLAYVNIHPKGLTIFEWLLALASASNYFTWISICLSHIRMRLAIKRQGRDVKELKWRSRWGLWGSIVAIVIHVIGLNAMIISAAKPPVPNHENSKVLVLVRNLLGFVVVVAAWLGYQSFHRNQPWIVDLKDVDLKALNAPSINARDGESVEQGSVELEEAKSSGSRDHR